MPTEPSELALNRLPFNENLLLRPSKINFWCYLIMRAAFDQSMLPTLHYICLLQGQESGINQCRDSQGHFMQQGPAKWNPAPKEIRETCKKAVQHAADQGIELPELAIKGIVALDPDIATHLVHFSQQPYSCTLCCYSSRLLAHDVLWSVRHKSVKEICTSNKLQPSFWKIVVAHALD